MLHLRCLLVWLAATAAAAATARWALDAVGASARFDGVVASVAGLALTGCALWAWVVTTVVVLSALRGRPRPRGVPAWVARAVLAACGVAVLNAVPAQASYDVTHAGAPRAPAVLDGLPFPDRAEGPARRTASAPPAPADRGTLVVRPGDSLWRIAADDLGPAASDAEVLAATRALIDLNRDVVGADPDLIHPGLRLRTPGS